MKSYLDEIFYFLPIDDINLIILILSRLTLVLTIKTTGITLMSLLWKTSVDKFKVSINEVLSFEAFEIFTF